MSGNSSCTQNTASTFFQCAFNAMRTLLLAPLYVLVLRAAHQRRRKQRVLATTSHSDAFTYHILALELIQIVGMVAYIVGVFTCDEPMTRVGLISSNILLYGETMFLLLTCTEWYLAVVRPVTYRGLRQSRGIRLRNALTAGVWLLSLSVVGVSSTLSLEKKSLLLLCSLILAVLAVSFCIVSVLCTLIGPRPGKRAKGAERVDKSKRRAVVSIAVISFSFWIWFLDLFVITALQSFGVDSLSKPMVLNVLLASCNVPSSVVSPLLYLHRAGKLTCCSE